MIQNFIKKITGIFKRKKTGAIPFAERSREAVKHTPFKEKKERADFRKEKAVTHEIKGPVRVRKDTKTPRPPRPRSVAPETITPWSVDEYSVPVEEGKVRFHDLNLPEPILHSVADLKYQYCTPVQAGILPSALTGRDAIGKAQTGTGKSAAFLITIFSHMFNNPIKGGPPKGQPRALILAPTRELVLQIEKDALGLCSHTPFKVLSVYGGTGYEKQMRSLQERPFEVIVATPGRLMDFQNKKLLRLDKIEILVLDEADRMLDMGFIPDVRKIVYSTPHKSKRQTFFYSATFSPEVNRLAEQWTTDPCIVEIEPDHVAAENVKQMVYITTSKEKFPLLYNLIFANRLERVLVFTNRRDQARDLAKKLQRHGIKTDLISGEVQQNKRIKALEDFRSGKCRVLVATDVAARGIHIVDISHVINYNLPQDPESYVHRIGRTGRAGSSGISVSFACEDDSFHIPDIEAFLGNDLVCEYPADELLIEPPQPERSSEATSDEKERYTTKQRPRPPRSRQKPSGERSSERSGERPTGNRSSKERVEGENPDKQQAPARKRRRRPPRKETGGSSPEQAPSQE